MLHQVRALGALDNRYSITARAGVASRTGHLPATGDVSVVTRRGGGRRGRAGGADWPL